MGESEFIPASRHDSAASQGAASAGARVRSFGLSLIAERSHEPDWLMVEEGFTLAREHEIESLFSIGNGYIGNRGSLAEGSPLSSPATFAAGVFEMQPRQGAVPGLFVLPDWTGVRAWIHGQPLNINEGEILDHRRILDFRRGVLWREWRHRDPNGRITRAVTLRFASLADRHLLAQSIWFVPENYVGRVILEGTIEVAPGIVASPPPDEWKARRGAHRHNVLPLALQAPGRDTIVAFAASSQLICHPGGAGQRDIEVSERRITERFAVDVELGAEYRLDRLISIYSTREVGNPVATALEHVHRVLPEGVRKVLSAHEAAWDARWHDADIRIEGDDRLQRALRFAEYHLISAADPDDERVSIGARALTGESYKGHVFWDTEIYMVPFFALTHPASARALLMYRYHLLAAAREKARAAGFRGAMYPWESADTGEETTPRYVIAPGGEVIQVLNGDMEVHITADIAYAAWQYWLVTGDDGFFANAGVELMIETARFWASRGKWEEEDGHFHIRNVIGPDEYHEDVDDNAFTNLIAAWNLRRAADAVRWMQQRSCEQWTGLSRRLALDHDEIQLWIKIADGMYRPFDAKTKLFEQFHGYFAKESIDLLAYEPRTTAMDVILGHTRIRETNVVKQADVVMAMFLLWDEFPPEVREANFHFYEPRTGHGSSLSPSIHALVAARLGQLDLAKKYVRQASEIDLGDNMGNAAGGVHAAAIGGLWQAMVFGFAGIDLDAGEIKLDPHLLNHWQRLHVPLQWRGRKLGFEIDHRTIRVEVESGVGPVPISLAHGSEVSIKVGQQVTTKRAERGWEPWHKER